MTRRSSLKALQGAAVLIAVVTLLTGCFSSLTGDALNLLNRDRATYGLKAPKTYGQLQTKAQNWADRLASQNTLYHSTLTSGVPSCWTGLGENVGYGSSVLAVELSFMASAPHRANILNSRYDWVGIGVARNGSRYFVVQVFMDGC